MWFYQSRNRHAHKKAKWSPLLVNVPSICANVCVCLMCVGKQQHPLQCKQHPRNINILTSEHHNKICTLISGTLSSSGTLGRRMHPGGEVQSPNPVEWGTHCPSLSPRPVNFTAFRRMHLSLISPSKARRHSRLNSVGRFGGGRLNGGHHTAREHKHMRTG